MHFVAKRPKLRSKRIYGWLPARHFCPEKIGDLFDQDSLGVKNLRKSDHFENQHPARVVYSAALPDLTEWLTWRAAMKQSEIASVQPQRIPQTLWVHQSNVHIPNDLPASIAAKRIRAVGIKIDGANRIETGLTHTDVHPTRARKKTQGGPLHDTTTFGLLFR